MPAVVLRPYPGESIASFVARFVGANGLGSAGWIWKEVTASERSLLDRLASPQVSAERTERLAEVLGLPVAEVSDLAIGPGGSANHGRRLVLGQLVNATDVASRIVRFCPLCLADYGYHKVLWQFRFVIACPEHGCLLFGTCPGCREISYSLPSGGMHCSRCHQDWRTVMPNAATEAAIAFSANVQVRLEERSPQVLLPISSASEFLDAGDLLAAMRGVVRLLALAPSAFKGVRWSDSEHVQTMARRAYVVMQRWPEGLFLELSDLWELGGRESLTRDSGFFQRAWSTVYSTPKNVSPTLVAAMDEYICNYWPRMSGMAATRAAGRRRHHLRSGGWQTGKEMCERMGVHIEYFSKLVHRGVIPAERTNLGRFGQGWRVQSTIANEIERAWSRNHRPMIYYKALGVVGKPAKRRHLRALGVLKNASGQRYLDPKYKFVSLDAIGIFFLRAEMGRRPAWRGRRRLCSISMVAGRVWADGLVEFSRRLQESELDVVIKGPRFHEWFVYEDDVRDLLDGESPFQTGSGLSVREVCTTYGFDSDFVSRWRRQLKGGAMTRQKRIAWADISDLLNQYISFGNIAKASGLNKRSLRLLLNGLGIHPLRAQGSPCVFLRTVFDLLYKGPRFKALPAPPAGRILTIRPGGVDLMPKLITVS